MKQFLISRLPEPGVGLELRGADFHYLGHVRRCKAGQVLACRTIEGQKLECRIREIAADYLILDAMEDSVAAIGPGSVVGDANLIPLHLVQGIPKGKKLEQIIRQATELGVASIRPLKCRHSIADLDERWENKRKHFEGVIREAFQQSGGRCLPTLLDPLDPTSYCRQANTDPNHLVFYFHELELEQTSLHRYLETKPASVTVIIGPEGGLAPEEIQLFKQAGFKGAWLGSQVLRTETAAIVAVGIVSLLIHELDSWSFREQDRK